MREFGGDETTADDHQMLGQFGDSHDRVAGVIVDPGRLDGRRVTGRAPAAITTFSAENSSPASVCNR